MDDEEGASIDIIRVPEVPLPRALIEHPEYSLLSEAGRREFLAHIRFMQQIPYKMREWLDHGHKAEELRALVLEIDLDISAHLGIPSGAQMELSAYSIRNVWVSHKKPLASWLAPNLVTDLNTEAPIIGASLSDVSAWIERVAKSLSGMFDGFFGATEYDAALAYLVAIHVYLAGIKFGMGRIEMQYPR